MMFSECFWMLYPQLRFIPNHTTSFHYIFIVMYTHKKIATILQILTLKHEKPNIGYTCGLC
jgi:hypothetical protein